MQCGSCGDLGDHRSAARGSGNLAAAHRFRGLLDFQRLDELVEETWNSVVQLPIGHSWRKPFGDLDPASLDQVSFVRRKEFVEHLASIRLRARSLCMLAHVSVTRVLPVSKREVPQRIRKLLQGADAAPFSSPAPAREPSFNIFLGRGDCSPELPQLFLAIMDRPEQRMSREELLQSMPGVRIQ